MVPTKPKRPCSYPGCPKLTDGRLCEEHAKAEAKRYEKYDRDPAVRRRYGRAWKRIRDRYIQEHPLCELCQQEGRLTTTRSRWRKAEPMRGTTSLPCVNPVTPESMPSAVTAGTSIDPVGG